MQYKNCGLFNQRDASRLRAVIMRRQRLVLVRREIARSKHARRSARDVSFHLTIEKLIRERSRKPVERTMQRAKVITRTIGGNAFWSELSLSFFVFDSARNLRKQSGNTFSPSFGEYIFLGVSASGLAGRTRTLCNTAFPIESPWITGNRVNCFFLFFFFFQIICWKTMDIVARSIY